MSEGPHDRRKSIGDDKAYEIIVDERLVCDATGWLRANFLLAIDTKQFPAVKDDRLEEDVKRGIKIVVSLAAVLMLLRPFDCFARGPRTREAMKCCLNGKCAPSAKADDCCKNSVPDANQFVSSNAIDHCAPVSAIAPSAIFEPVPTLVFHALVDLPQHPPPRGNLTARTLPLLI